MSTVAISNFADSLSEDIQRLPNIQFNENVSSLNQYAEIIQNAVLSRCDETKLKNPETRTAELLSKYDELRSSGLFNSVFELLDQTAGYLSSGLNTSFIKLQDDVAPEVNDLEQALSTVNESADDHIVEDGGDVEPEPTDNASANMHILNWQAYTNLLGGKEVLVDYHKNNYKYASENFTDVQYVIGSGKLTIEPIEGVNRQQLDREIGRVVNKMCGDNATAAFDMMNVFKVATDPHEFNRNVNALQIVASGSDIGNHIDTLTDFITTTNSVLRAAEKCRFNLSAKACEQIANNLKKVHELMMLEGYALLAARKNYRNALVINRHTINGDVYDEFIDQGGKMVDINRYLNFYHPSSRSKTLPVKGIYLKSVLDAKQDLATHYTEDLKRNTAKQNRLKLERKMRETNALLNDYLANVPDTRIPEGMSRAEYVRSNQRYVDSVVTQLDRDPDHNTQRLLYDFVFQTQYFGTPLPHLHSQMSERLVTQLNRNDAPIKVTKQMQNDIMRDVGCETIANFIATKILN